MKTPKNQSNPHGLTVGQELFVVYDERRRAGGNRPVIVTKIGRKWVDICEGRYRIDAETLRIDGKGFSSPGRCYLTEQAYREEAEIKDAWWSLYRRIDRMHSMPAGMTIEKMDQIADLLGIDRSEA
jgi:hypothetical protein